MILPSAKPIVAPPGKFRRWIHSDMLVLRWVLLALYVLIAGGLLVMWWDEWRETFILTVLGAMQRETESCAARGR